MTSGVDWESREQAFKTLLVFFIIFPTMANVVLIAHLICAVGGFKPLASGRRGARCVTLIFMAAADALTAVYGMSMLVGDLFTETQRCDKLLPAYYFVFYVTPFVNGLVLVALCCESLVFWGRCSLVEDNIPGRRMHTLPWMGNLVLGAVPLLIGFSVSLPVCLAEFDYDQCVFEHDNYARLRLMEYVCGVLPAALVLAFAALNVRDRGSSRQQSISPAWGLHHTAQTGSPPEWVRYKANSTTGRPSVNRYTHCPDFLYLSLDNVRSRDNLPATLPGPYGTSQPFSYINTASDRQDAVRSAFPPKNCGLPTSRKNCNDVQQELNLISSLERTADVANAYNAAVEKYTHVIVAVAYVLCVLPKVMYELWFVLGTDRSAPQEENLRHIVLSDLVFWLACLRGVIMPCVWLLSGSLAKRSLLAY